MATQKPREIAVRLLLDRQEGRFVEDLLDAALKGPAAHLKPEDRRLLQEIVYGVVRWELTLDWLVDQKSGGKPQKPLVREILRTALYQMFWLERVPSYAAVNEAVEICKTTGFASQARFVNAVLRGYGREADATRGKLKEFRQTNLSLGFSHPSWLCDRWQERWSLPETIQLLDWNNSPPPVYARLNTLKATAEALRQAWKEENVEFAETNFDWVPTAQLFQLLAHPPIASLPSFQAGHFYVQDPSTLLAPAMLQARSGDTVLDLCSAPGGKATFLAQYLHNEVKILAADIDPARLRLVEENVRRLGTSSITTDPAAFPAKHAFDRVPVDVPCSNTGVMRRRLELRWRIKPEEIQRLALTQLNLLDSAAQRTRPGGTLVYSTCSLEPAPGRRDRRRLSR